jgi:hypothetical protein
VCKGAGPRDDKILGILASSQGVERFVEGFSLISSDLSPYNAAWAYVSKFESSKRELNARRNQDLRLRKSDEDDHD